MVLVRRPRRGHPHDDPPCRPCCRPDPADPDPPRRRPRRSTPDRPAGGRRRTRRWPQPTGSSISKPRNGPSPHRQDRRCSGPSRRPSPQVSQSRSRVSPRWRDRGADEPTEAKDSRPPTAMPSDSVSSSGTLTEGSPGLAGTRSSASTGGLASNVQRTDSRAPITSAVSSPREDAVPASDSRSTRSPVRTSVPDRGVAGDRVRPTPAEASVVDRPLRRRWR